MGQNQVWKTGMTRRSRVLIFSAASLMVFLSGCKYIQRFTQRPKFSTLVVGFVESKFSFDWQKEMNSPSVLAVTHLMEGLVDYQTDGSKVRIIPALAEKWESKSDSTVWTFHLRKAKWSDGEELRSEHFVNAFRRLLTPENDSPFADLLFPVKNAREFYEGKVKFFSEVGIKTPDSSTIIFEFGSPQPLFLDLLANPSLYPLRNEHLELFAGRKKKLELIPWIGPYRLILSAKRRVQLFENVTYYKSRGIFQKIDFLLDNRKEKLVNLLNEKKIDISFDIDSQPPLKYVSSLAAPHFSFFQLVIGCTQKPLSNPILRRVIALSINKEELAKLVPETQSIGGVIPPGVEGYESNRGMKYDSEMATLVLKNAHEEKILPSFTYDLYVDKKLGAVGMVTAEALKEQLKKSLGMELKILQIEFSTSRVDFNKSRPYMILEKVLGRSLNPYFYLAPYTKAAFQIRSGWKNRNFDEFLKKLSPAKAQHLLVEEENPVIPLFSFYDQILALPYVRGLEQSFMRLIDFRTLSEDKK